MSTATIPPVESPPAAALLDVKAVARMLDCSPRHVYRLADCGKLPRPIKLGALVRWKLDGPGGLHEWLADNCKPVRNIHH